VLGNRCVHRVEVGWSGDRANIDEFTETTSHTLETAGGAEHGKVVIILNPAEPPLIMRDTVFCLSEDADVDAIRASVEEMVQSVGNTFLGTA